MKIRVADYITEFLVKKGVDKTFFLSGGGMMHLIDAVSKQEGLDYICNHHEQSSSMAADAYARMKGDLAACYLTAGPGTTNAVTGITGAWLDSSPVLFISGQAKLSQTIRGSKLDKLRQFGTFEVDILPVIESITKYSAFLDDPKMLKYHLEKAYALATSGRPGPVFIDIPINLQGATIETDDLIEFNEIIPSFPANENQVQRVLAAILAAKRPVIIAGHGVRSSGSAKHFYELIKKLNIPVVTTPLAADLLEYDNELYIGHVGGKGDRAGNLAVQNSDFILSLGNSMHVMTTGYEVDDFAPNAYIAMVELDESVRLRQEIKVDEFIEASIESFLEESLKIIQGQFERAGWNKHCLMMKKELSVMNEPHKREETVTGTTISYYDITDSLSRLSGEGDVLVADSGSGFYLAGQAYRTKKDQRIINSGGLGAMGFALPASTGVCAADKNKKVLCLVGDGSFQTNIHELAVIKSYGLNVKVIVVNNGGYVSIRNSQSNYFSGNLVGSSEESGVWLPEVSKIASSYELDYFKCDRLEDLDSSMKKVLDHSGPVLFEVYIPHDLKIIPMVSSMKLDDGSMVSKPLHEMFPFLSKEKLKKYMYNE